MRLENLRSWFSDGMLAIQASLLQERWRERGQTIIEAAMIMGFVSILAMTVLTALGDITGGAFAEVSQVFSHAGSHGSVDASNVYRGPRIAE
jgi:Flp pilus assembly pilin Flp